MTRWTAAGLHLGVSLLIIGAVAAGLIGLWYGWTYFSMMGGLRLLGILAVVDIVIGPLLTAIVYRPGKPSLRFDLTVIALLQLGFLAYGGFIMAQSRPVFLVGVQDRFELVFANELDEADVAAAPEPYRRLSWTGPTLVGVAFPADGDERMALIQSGLAGKDVQLLPRYFAHYSVSAPKLAAAASPVQALLDSSKPADRDRLQRAIGGFDLAPDAVRTLPIISRRGRATMLVRAETAEPLRPVGVEPWTDMPWTPPPDSE